MLRPLLLVLLLVAGCCQTTADDNLPNNTAGAISSTSAKASAGKGTGTPSVPGSYIKKGTPGHMASTFFTRNARLIRRAKLELLRTVFATAVFFVLSLIVYSCIYILGLDSYAENQVVVSASPNDDRRVFPFGHISIYMAPMSITFLDWLFSRLTDVDHTGRVIWPSAKICARFVGVHPAGKELILNKTVLEIGSGAGMPGIMSAMWSKRTVMTDGNSVVLDILHENVQEHRLGLVAEHKLKHNVNQKAKLEEAEAQVNGEITPAELERAAADRHRRFNHLERDFSPEIKRLVWGDSNDYATILELEPDGFDVIIGADVVYYDVEILWDTVSTLLKDSPKAVFMTAFESRFETTEQFFLDCAKQHGFTTTEIDAAREMSPFVRPDGRLFLFQWSKFVKRDDQLIERNVKGKQKPESKTSAAEEKPEIKNVKTAGKVKTVAKKNKASGSRPEQ